MTKRSSHVALAILGAAAFTLAGCSEEEVDAQAFPDLRACHSAAAAGGGITAAECDTSFANAQALHVESAPRYDSLEVCEAQHGEGACGNEQQASDGGGSGSIFMPLMMGYLLGNMMSNRSGMAAAQPLYKTADGRYTNASGSSTFSNNSGAGKMSSSQFTRPPSTVNKAPMTAATAQARGGFGGTKAPAASAGG